MYSGQSWRTRDPRMGTCLNLSASSARFGLWVTNLIGRVLGAERVSSVAGAGQAAWLAVPGAACQVRRTMPVLLRYVLLQLPGWALASALLYAARSEWGLSGPLALGALAVWIAKDFVLYPFVRSAYALAPSRLIGPEQLIGREGVAEDALSPLGHVRIGGERWRAESSHPVPPGGRVRVRSLVGLTVQVEPVGDSNDG